MTGTRSAVEEYQGRNIIPSDITEYFEINETTRAALPRNVEGDPALPHGELWYHD